MARMIYASKREQNLFPAGRHAIVQDGDRRVLWNGREHLFYDIGQGELKGLLMRDLLAPVSVDMPDNWDDYQLEQYLPRYLLPAEVRNSG